MGFWGGGSGAGGWSQGLGGQSMGPRSGRNSDGWDDEYLGKVYDAEVVRRVVPYIAEWKRHAFVAFGTMVLYSVTTFIAPLIIGLIITAGLNHDKQKVIIFGVVLVVLAVLQWVSQTVQQYTTAWMGSRILLKLRSQMYDHIQNLSLSFFDEMEVGRIISRLTSDVTTVQDLVTTGSLTSLSNLVGISIVVVVLLVMDWQLALITFAVIPPLVLIMAWWAKLARNAFMQTRDVPRGQEQPDLRQAQR
ncbi:hypothetical protein J0H33_11465 [bacterium]|nr:hypothetical protein [bacterium]